MKYFIFNFLDEGNCLEEAILHIQGLGRQKVHKLSDCIQFIIDISLNKNYL